MPSAVNTNGTSQSSALCSIEEFLDHKYDYVVVGGGTAGLCVAARLTEDPNVHVAVLEAGLDRMADPLVSTPIAYGQIIGRKDYDWCMNSVPQPTAGNKIYSMPRGKLLGGSSAINYLMYVRGSRGDYDGWESLGNKGWGWDEFAPYFRKHQKLDPPETAHPDKQFMPAAADDKYHGTDGPIHTSFNDFYAPYEEDWVKACYEVGEREKTLVDAWSGDHMGFYSSLGTINRTDDPGNRSYAATGYLRPNLGRPNLKVLTDAHVTKVVLNEFKHAFAVEFLHQGSRHIVPAAQEVVLSAGAIQSPQLLELSGIGDPEVLKAAGVECLVENKRVGANFQDHVLAGMKYELADGITSLDALHGAEYAKAQQEVYGKTHNGPYGSPAMTMGFVSYASLVSQEQLEKTIATIKRDSLAKTDFEKAQEQVIIDQLSDPTFANIQVYCVAASLDLAEGSDQVKFLGPPPTGKNRAMLGVCLQHPLSRGTVHITSSDPLAPPRIDPGYFRNESDLTVLVEGMKWMDKVAKRPVFNKSLGARVQPAESVDVENEEEVKEYLRNHISTQYHIIGSCAMGEVVDDRLKVKGVTGLRVIDSSVFPTHISGNTMATTYAVAEKGADLLKADGPFGSAQKAA